MAEKGEALSDRELEVLQCVIDGAGNKDIAATLVISQNTVKVHLRNIYTKLGVSSRTEATTAALQQGLVSLEGIITEAESGANSQGNQTQEDALSTASARPSSLELSGAEVQPRPTILPRRIAWTSLGLVLLIALIFAGYQLFGETLASTPEPFAQTALTDDWLQSRPLPAARTHMALIGSGLNLYLIGGETAEESASNSVAILDTSTLVWQEGEAKPTAVTEITGAELFGEIYVPGGKLANGQPTNVVEVYSPANDNWRVTTPLPTAVSGGLVLSDGSFLYLFGGWDGQNYLDTAYRFDVAANNWQILPDMPTARAFVTGGLVKGKLYVVGGYDGERPLSTCAYFDPTTNADEDTENEGSWHSCANLLLPRAGASAAALLNKLYVFGGGAFGEESITYSESYNPDAGQWSVVNTPPLDDKSGWMHLGITNIETNIYAVGGVLGSQATAETFVYRPLVYQTFIPIAPVEGGGQGQ